MPQSTDEEVAACVQRGDSDAFGTLIERYDEKMGRYAHRFMADDEDVKDIVQELFIKAYVNIRSFDTSRKFSSWLYRIAHNEFVNALKKKKREMVSFVDFDELYPGPVSDRTADSQAQHAELRQMLETHLQEISLRYREPLILSYFDELNYNEIADVLRIPVSTVGVRLKRGREALRKVMSDGPVKKKNL